MFQSLASIRTNNFQDPDMIEKITQLWADVANHNIDQAAPIYGIYHQYASNYRGDYTLSIAQKVGEDAGDIPQSMEYREFPAENASPEAIYAVWQMIWQLEETHEIDRAYEVDYEEYRPDGTASVFISIY